MPSELSGFVRFRPQHLMSGEATSDIVNRPCPRTIAYAGKLIKAGLDSMEVLAGAVGEGAAVELIGFLKTFRELPDIDDVIENPTTAHVPTEASAMYAVMAALLERLDKKNAVSIMKYGVRLPVDLCAALFTDMVVKEPKVQETRTFNEWVTKHQDILL